MIKKLLFSNLLLLVAASAFSQGLKVTNLRCDGRKNPDGIATIKPALSWNIEAVGYNVMQSAYRILVADDSVALQKGMGNMWDSQKVNSGTSLNVLYNGKPLQSAKKYYWRLMVWDNKGNASARRYRPVANGTIKYR
jgi:hypothetical protein